jgi:hypothetical protein
LSRFESDEDERFDMNSLDVIELTLSTGAAKEEVEDED